MDGEAIFERDENDNHAEHTFASDGADMLTWVYTSVANSGKMYAEAFRLSNTIGMVSS